MTKNNGGKRVPPLNPRKDRRQSDPTLRQWTDAVDAIRDPIFIHDRQLRIVRANHAYVAASGLTLDQMIGKPYWEVFPKTQGPLPGCLHALEKDTGEEEHGEIASETGEIFFCRTFPVYGASGEYLHSVHILEDITERRQMETALRQSEQLYRQIVETSLEGICILDTEGRPTYVNQRLVTMLGFAEEELIGRPFHTFMDAESGKLHARCFAHCMAGARELCDLRMVAKDGSDLWTMVSFGPILDQQGQSVGVLGMVVDVTARKKAETQVRLAAQVFDTAAKGIMILDADKNVVEVNRAFTQATGFEAQEVVGKKPWFLGGSLQDEAFYQGIWQALRKTGNWRGEIDNRRKNGEVIPALLNVSAVRDEHGEITHYAAIFSDIADLKAAQRQLEYLATYDTLTGLPNRNLFYDRLQHGVEKASRDGKRLALFFVDLDNFKTINDTLGHEMGDRLLAQVADRLSACTRREDTVARLGGDEFAIITEDVAHPGAEAAITARHMIAALSAPFKLDNQEVFVSASIGIALFPDNGRDAAALLRNADTAMYKAKDLGKNSYHFFTEELDMRAAERAATENGLRHALKHDEFFLFYQPQMELDSGCIVGFEALLRWQHPDFGLLLPEHFIPVAETSGLIVPIGKWVMRTACRQIRDWSRQGLGDFRIAVNLSARQFRQKKFAEAIREIIEEMEIEPSNLEVELTESTLMDDAEHAGRVLRQLKEMGVHIAIDDFGTGYSSLQYLKKFPIDHLKIDSHFVNDIATNRDDAAIAMAIITMGHSMQMKVVAEGVETSEQLAFLRASGCDVIQGYIVNMPLSVGNAATALRENAHCHRLSS